MKNAMLMLMCLVMFTVSCAGTAPNPIAIYRVGDEKKSCSALRAELSNMDRQVRMKRSQKSQKDIANVVYLIGGVFILIPWFFIDLKGAEQVEIDAFLARTDALTIIYAEKECGTFIPVTPTF